jgi:hypothetical protein
MNRKQKMDRSTIVVRVAGLCAGELDGEAVLMSVDQGRYYGMDPIGTRIWGLIENPVAVSDICDQLRKEYKVTPEDCERDVLTFLNELAEANLLRVIDDTPA